MEEEGCTLAAGLTLGPYELVEKVGEGGFGSVWTARHREWPDRVHAFKFPQDERFLEPLRAEGNTLRELAHDNIVAIHDIDTLCAHPYIRMEYVEGESLEQRLARSERLDPNEAERIVREVLKALDYAHGRGVIHRDLKPGNILLGLDKSVKLTDFGLARVTSEISRDLAASLDSLETQKTSMAGTLDYMAPEQKRGEAPDPRADIYSLGVLFYRCLTGRLPKSLKPPSHFNPAVPARIDRVVAGMLDPVEERIARAELVLAALDLEDVGDPVPVREEELHVRSFNPVGEVAFGAAVAGAAALLLGLRTLPAVPALMGGTVLLLLAVLFSRMSAAPLRAAALWTGLVLVIVGPRLHWTLLWLGIAAMAFTVITGGFQLAMMGQGEGKDDTGDESEK